MDGVNQNNQAQQAPAPAPAKQNNAKQQNKGVSDKEANDFADKINKENGKDKKANSKEDQTLESLLAERRKNTKDSVQGRLKDQQKDEGRGGDSQQSKDPLAELGLTKTSEAQIKADLQVRETQQVNSVKEVNAILQKMADQIHVSSKDAVNGAEIRISLKDNVLPGTEVRIHRHGGELTVTLNTTSAETNNFLAQHEASLQKTLADRFGNEKVQVNINMSGGDNQENDGRSRNEYVAEDDDQKDNH